MIIKSRFRAAGSLAAAVAILATALPVAYAADPPATGPANLDDEFAEIAAKVPGFGGAFYDEDGSFTLQLVDLSKQDAAKAATEELRNRSSPAPQTRPGGIPQPGVGQVKTLQARYDFRELRDIRVTARDEVLSLPGTVSLEVDEKRNRVVVGVEKQDQIGAVRNQFAKLGVTADAVIVEVTDAIKPMATLRDNVRPGEGGLQIALSGGGLCTLGFNAYAGERRSFLTASHCTNTRGGVEYTAYYQPDIGGYIGFEYRDPAYWPCGFLLEWRCRYSDAALAAYNNTVSSDLGQIARTTSRGSPTPMEFIWWGSKAGSITIDSSKPKFYIRGQKQNPLGGVMLEKVGRTTGWTWGFVYSTCADVNVKDTNIRLLCQDKVSGGVGPGDSGSAVFRWGYGSQNYGDDVELNGLLWGGNDAGTHFVFSTMSNVEHELGDLITCSCVIGAIQ
jgi:hypothetical protein